RNRAPDRVADRVVEDENASKSVGERTTAACVDADVVALEQVAVRSRGPDHYAPVDVPRDHVARARDSASDYIAGRTAAEADALQVADRIGAGGVGADVVARDR